MHLHILSSAILEMNKLAKYVIKKLKRMAINMLRITVQKNSEIFEEKHPHEMKLLL